MEKRRIIKIGNRTIIIDNVPDSTTDRELRYIALRKLGQECLIKSANEKTYIGVAD